MWRRARDALLQEYIDQGITNAGIADECEDFYFVEPEFNQPRDNRHQPWGLENATVRGVFDGARAEYGTRYGGTITVTGGYRSPAKNAKLPKASKRSHHIFGQAIDMRGNWARGATSARAREEFYRLRRLFPVGTTVCATEWDRYVDDRHLHISLKEKACRGGGNRMGVVVADASPQDVPSRAEQKALARDLRSGDAERVMEAAYRLYDVAAEEWDSDFRRAVADVYVRETKADFARRVLSGDEALTLRDMVWSIAFAGDPVVIPALLLTPTSPNALYQLGEPAFRAVLDMVLSSSPGQFAEDRGRGVTPTMYAGGLDALVMFVDNDGIDDFDGLAQSQLRAVALRTLQSARRGWMMIAAMPLAVAVDDAAAIAMVEALTDKAEIRARGVTHPGEIDMIAQKAREALTGRKR